MLRTKPNTSTGSRQCLEIRRGGPLRNPGVAGPADDSRGAPPDGADGAAPVRQRPPSVALRLRSAPNLTAPAVRAGLLEQAKNANEYGRFFDFSRLPIPKKPQKAFGRNGPHHPRTPANARERGRRRIAPAGPRKEAGSGAVPLPEGRPIGSARSRPSVRFNGDHSPRSRASVRYRRRSDTGSRRVTVTVTVTSFPSSSLGSQYTLT